MTRPYILRTQPGAKVLIVAVHGLGQHPTQPAKLLKGRLGLPFIDFCGFDKFPFPVNVVYPVARARDWHPNGKADARLILDCAEVFVALSRPKTVVLFGFSDGGTMAHSCVDGWPWHVVCVASGWVPKKMKLQFSRPRVLLHSGDTGKVEKAALKQAIEAERIYQQAGADVTRLVTPGLRHDWPAAMNKTLAEFIRGTK